MEMRDSDPSSLFMGNYFCRIEKYRMAFVTISKNGVTFLKNLAIYHKYGILPQKEEMTHQLIGFSDASPFLFTAPQLRELEEIEGKILKFAVWRDPVDRLISSYKFFCLEKNERTYFRYLDLYHDHSFERFMEFVEFELRKSNPLFQDEHIRRQCDCYELSDVDVIIPIDKLNQFLLEQGVVLPEKKANETSTSFDFNQEKWEERIKELYAPDYRLKPDV